MKDQNREEYKTIYAQAQSSYRKHQYLDCINVLDKHTDLFVLPGEIISVYTLKGYAYDNMGLYAQALECYRRVLESNSHNENLYFLIAGCYRNLKRRQEEVKTYLAAIQLYPKNTYLYLNLASVYQDLGMLDFARECYRRMIVLEPTHAKAYRNLVDCIVYTDENNVERDAITKLLCQPAINREDALQCHFALGKMYQDCQNYPKALYHYHEGNALLSTIQSTDILSYIKTTEGLIHQYSQNFLQGCALQPVESEVPIFVVGIPRSGKSMIEALICQNPQAYYAGEAACFEDIMKKNMGEIDIDKFTEYFKNQFNQEKLNEIAGDYLAYLAKNVPQGKSRLIDTTPTNFKYLGLISLLFKNPKIIHCVRHPLDHCIQIYFKYFAQGNRYSTNLVTLAHYYVQYRRLMTHWQKTLKIEILTVSYENLIQNTSAVAKSIDEYLGLENTVHQPALSSEGESYHQNEIGFYKHFEHCLDELKHILKDHGIAWG